MSKIYLVRGSLTNLIIIEVELIKQTAEQLRVNESSVRVVWRARTDAYNPHVSSRLQRHREHYFTTLRDAIEYATGTLKKDLERALANMHAAQLLIAELAALSDAQKEPTNAV